jgi:hypothetical protein
MEELLKVAKGLMLLDPLLCNEDVRKLEAEPYLNGYKTDIGRWQGLLELLTFVGFEIGFTKDCIRVYSRSQLYSDKVYKGSCHAEALFNMFLANQYLLRRDFYCNDCYTKVKSRYSNK